MRLKLNRTLRAALIAAISTVGFTTFGIGSIALGGEVAVTIGGNVITASGVQIGGNNNTGSATTSGSTFAANFSTMNPIVTTDNQWYSNTNDSNVDGVNKVANAATIITDGPGGNTHPKWAAFSYTLSSAVLGQIVENTAITLSFDINVSGGNNKNKGQGVAITLLSSGGNSETFTYGNSSGTSTPAEHAVLTLGAETVNALRASGESQKLIFYFQDTQDVTGTNEAWTMKNMVLKYTEVDASSYTWAATETSAWTDTVWKTSPDGDLVDFVPNSDAVFDNTATATQVNITSAVSAKNVTVGGKDYTFNLDAGGSLAVISALKVTSGSQSIVMNGGSLTPGNVTIDAGASLSITGSGDLSISSLAGAGGFVKDSSGTLSLSGHDSFSGTITVNAGKLALATMGAATYTVASDAVIEVTNANMAAVGTLTVAGDGTVRLVTTSRSESGNALGTLSASNLELADNSSNTGRFFYGGSSNIAGVGNLKFAGGQLWLTSDMTYGGGVTFGTTTYTESNDFAGAAMRVNASGTFNGAVNVQGTAKLVWGESNKTLAFNNTVTGSGAINLIGWNGKTGTFTIGGDASGYEGAITTNDKITLNVTDSGKLNIGTGSNLAGAVTLNGALTVNGAATISGNITGAGSITKAGEGTLVLSGAANVLNKTIDVQSGELRLSGTFDITGNEGAMTATYTEGDNGFKITSGTITVYTKGEGAEVTIVDGTQFIYGTTPVTLTPEGKYVVSEHTDYSTYYVRVGSANFSSALAQQDMRYVEMSDNTTLNMDASGALTTLTTHGAASLANVGQDRHSLTLGSVAGEGSVAVGEQIDVTIAGTISGTKDLTALKLASGATAQVTMGTGAAEIVNFGEGSGTVVLEGGSLSYRSNLNGNTLQMQEGSVLLFGNAGDDADHTYEGDIVVVENATVTTYGTSQHPTATISGAVSGEGTLTRADDGNQTLAFTGTVDLGGFTNNDAQGGNLTDFRGVTKLGTLTVGNSSKTKFSNESTTIGAVVVNGTGTTEFAHDVSIADVSTTGGHQWTLNALDSATVTVTDEAGSLYKLQTNGNVVLAEGTTMTLDNNLVPFSGTLAVNGVVNVKGDVDLSEHNASTGTLAIGATGQVTAAGMWMRHEASITLEQGGQLNVAGLNIVGNGANSSIAYNPAGESAFGTNNDKFAITNAIVTATADNVTLGNTLTGVTVNTGAHAVTLNSNADSVIVNTGGTFTLGEGKTVTNITVEDGGTIAGGVDATQVGIHSDATATFDEGIINSGVTFSADEGVKVYNKGEVTAVYGGIGDTNMQVTADVLVSEAETAVTVANKVLVSEITNAGLGTLTITNVDTEVLTDVVAFSADVTLQNVGADPIELENLSLYGTTVAVYQSTDEAAALEGTVTITDTLTAGGGTLLANLTMAHGSTLDVNGGDDMALTLGSQFTIEEGTLVTLDVATLEAIAGLQNIGDKVVLLRAYTDGDGMRELTSNLTTGDWARTHFDLSSITGADYQLFVQDGQIGLVKSSMVPEPTTGTLSLLALAALAARRRRK